MRILYVSHSFPPADRPLSNVGGMQRVATELQTSLSEHPGVSLQSLVMRSTWRWTHVKTLPFLAGAWGKIYTRVVRGEVDAILFSSMVTASLAVFLRRTLRENGVATAAIVHGRDVTLAMPPYQQFVPEIFGALDLVLPVSRATAEACLARGLKESRLAVVPNGIVVDRFGGNGAGDVSGGRDARQRLLERFGDSAGSRRALILCSVGRQVKRKGFTWFVDSVMPLLPRNVQYWLAGDGPEAASIAAAARRRGLSERVRLLGRIPDHDLGLLYKGADLFVMPNVPVPGDMEGFGIVMLEAGLCGLPTIASRLEGITDVIEDGTNGRLVESGDAWGFSEEIVRYLHNPMLLRAARERTAALVRERFGWQAVASTYVRMLESSSRSLVPEGHETAFA